VDITFYQIKTNRLFTLVYNMTAFFHARYTPLLRQMNE